MVRWDWGFEKLGGELTRHESNSTKVTTIEELGKNLPKRLSDIANYRENLIIYQGEELLPVVIMTLEELESLQETMSHLSSIYLQAIEELQEELRECTSVSGEEIKKIIKKRLQKGLKK